MSLRQYIYDLHLEGFKCC